MTSEVQIERIEHFIGSSDGTSQLRVLLWIPYLPENELKGIVQIVHGMEEHIDRYDEFARFLARNGFVVGAHDHVGHGKSVLDVRDLGHITLDQGDAVLVNDVDRVRRALFEQFSDLPYFIFGHSMGSFVTRVYLSEHAQGVQGAIICGTGNQPALLARSGNLLAHTIGTVMGERYKSKVLDSMGAGGFARAIENPRTPLDWISVDPAVVEPISMTRSVGSCSRWVGMQRSPGWSHVRSIHAWQHAFRKICRCCSSQAPKIPWARMAKRSFAQSSCIAMRA